RLLEASRHTENKPFIVFASTVTVVGITQPQPTNEAQECLPVTIYDLHKLIAEQYLEAYCRLNQAHGTTLRLANVYGPGSSAVVEDRGILNKMMRRALNEESLTMFGSGEWYRDYVYIDDVLAAISAALHHQIETNGRHWIVGS